MNVEKAKIAINKSLLKEYKTNECDRTVYLENGDEFQIQLFNPETDNIGAKISINGKELSNMIIIRPGERVWLERYLDKRAKFKFTTYEVEDNNDEVNKAIVNNGEVKISFYRKKENQYISSTYDINYNKIFSSGDYLKMPEPLYGSSVCTNNCLSSTANYSTNVDTSVTNELTGKIKYCSALENTTKETGQIGTGSYSNQDFEYVYENYDHWAFAIETIKILPKSRKVYTANDLEKIYCSNCGRKLKTKYKFCPYCGTEID